MIKTDSQWRSEARDSHSVLIANGWLGVDDNAGWYIYNTERYLNGSGDFDRTDWLQLNIEDETSWQHVRRVDGKDQLISEGLDAAGLAQYMDAFGLDGHPDTRD